jgi:hypothetical protein
MTVLHIYFRDDFFHNLWIQASTLNFMIYYLLFSTYYSREPPIPLSVSHDLVLPVTCV